jgi:hypothetical protein
MKLSETPDGIPLMEDADSDHEDRSIGSFDFETSSIKASTQGASRAYFFLNWTKRKIIILFIAILIALVGIYLVFFHSWNASGGEGTSLRPGIHFAAPVGTWLNDPNGLYVDKDGVWHMYYQRESHRPIFLIADSVLIRSLS